MSDSPDTTTPLAPHDDAPPPVVGVELLSAPFLGLLATQLLTALNDNIFRWLVIGVGKPMVGKSYETLVLSLGAACFVLPYILLAAPAGFLADRHSKRSVIVACKLAEIGIMTLGVLAVLLQQPWLLFAVVALTGAQSALFAPAKSGAIPEMLRVEHIATANGWFGLTTVVATVIGMAIGNLLSDWTNARGAAGVWLPGGVLLGVAVVGYAVSLWVVKLPAANPRRRFPWDAASQTWRDVRLLASNRALFRVAMGIVFFWSIGALAQLNIDQFGFEGGATRQADIVPFLLALVAGVGLGSVAAGYWSAGRVELGILPLGAGGMAISAILLFAVRGALFDYEGRTDITGSYVVACGLLFVLGASAGLFNVPLEAFMQHRSPARQRGSILAACNMLTFSGTLLVAILFSVLRVNVLEGRLEHVPLLPQVTLSANDQQRLVALEDQLRTSWQRGVPLPLEEVLDEALFIDPAYALARLMWVELEQRRASGEVMGGAAREAYLVRFPERAPLVGEVFDQSHGRPLFSSRQIFLLCGLATIPVFIYIVGVIPQATIRFAVWLLSHTLYRIRVSGREHLPATGGALLAPNHVSWLDGVLLLLTSSRPVRMVVYAGNFTNPWLRRLAESFGAIMLESKPKAMVAALRTARQALVDGELVCVFGEGGITRTGQLQGFKPGMMKILEGTGAPVVPVYLDGLWGSIFSFERGRFFWKWPRGVPYPIDIHFGPPLAAPADIHQVRQAVQALGAQAVRERMQRATLVTQQLVRSCKRQKFRSKAADSLGANLTGGQLLMRALILRRLLRRLALADDEKYIGVLLPPSVPAVVVNAALGLDRRVAVNLNYTVSSAVLNSCLRQAGIRHVLTSQKFLDKMNFELEADVVLLENFKEQVTLADKLTSAWSAYATPARWLERRLGLHQVEPDDELTVIFTSGSTGEPKGVMLTHANIASNVQAIDQVIHLRPDDVLLGVLPLFHSFGYTVTFWAAMALNVKGAYHFSPLEPKQVGKLAQEQKCTVLLATPTFLRSYLRRCSQEEFATLDVAVAGAEKLPKDLSDAFEEKFGFRPVEGYGCTELSPLVSVNIPASRSLGNFQIDAKEGTVGRPVPGVSAKVVDVDTGEELGAGRPGMLWIKGPNVMKGYLGRPDLTAEVVVDGWYKTGDVALIDNDGFIQITGRLSRFSKIGGEMVPHILVEEHLNQLMGAGEEAGQQAAIASAPDAKKGERLVVLHLPLAGKSPEQLCAGLAERGLPNIFIPSPDSFLEVPELPLLGTGKLDLQRLQQLAREHFAPRE